MTAYWDNGPVQLYQADARSIPLPDQSVHCVVTSPPYFGLRVYKDNDDRGIGLESTVEDYIGNLVDVFRDVRRVLRDDGVAWLNLGDSYAHDRGYQVTDSKHTDVGNNHGSEVPHGLKSGDRLGIPERVVLALQADGWIWRDTIIWAKKSAMPESLAGWRWERCRVKGDNLRIDVNAPNPDRGDGGYGGGEGGIAAKPYAEYADCPGCPKCEANDGLVLRKGSWRTTSAHEYIYMLTKGMGYYADGEAVKTKIANDLRVAEADGTANDTPWNNNPNGHMGTAQSGANRRSVWNDISPEPYGGSHFATFPSDLPRICIQASTSERGCCSECGRQWARVVERTKTGQGHDSPKDINPDRNDGPGLGSLHTQYFDIESTTLGWRPTCNHDASAIPATVLDPFSGTATTCRAAQKLGRRAVGVDISESYLEQAVRRLSAVTLPMGI